MRAFIAVELPDEVKEKVIALQRELPQTGTRPVKKEVMHITLKFLGEITEQQAENVKEIISSVRFEPFVVSCKGVGVFPNEKFIRVVWAGAENAQLSKIASELEDKLAEMGFRKEGFASHITISRVSAPIEINEFLEKYKEQEFGQFEVREIKLKKSTLTSQGPIYTDV